MGVSDIAECGRFDFVCQAARRVAKGAVYGQWAQENIVQVRNILLLVYVTAFLKTVVVGAVLPRPIQTGDLP
jgi:hypothetical protein